MASAVTTAPAPERGQHAEAAEEARHPSGWIPVVFSLAVYVALAFLANWNVWVHGFAHTVQGSGGGDVGEEVWFLAQTPWAIVHGVNPFDSNWLNAPYGVDLMDNTTMPLLGLLGMPVTLLFGPIATFNLMIGLAFAGSAAAFFFMARQFVRWWPAAFVGGLLYGFSPIAVGEARGHLFIAFAVVPPLVILVIHHFVRVEYGRPWLHGLALAGCFAAQFYISSEVFASLVVVSLIGVAVGALLSIRRWQFDLRQGLKLLAATAAFGSLFIGFGAWTALEGPQHIDGPAQPAVAIAGVSSDPAGLVIPTSNQRFSFDDSDGDTYVAQRDATWHLVAASVAENGTYVGVPLLLALLGGIVLLRRNRVAVFAAIMAAVAMVLSMGARLHFNGHRTGVPLPFALLDHVPLLQSAVASRYAVFFWLFAALLFVFTLDKMFTVLRSRSRWLAGSVCILVASIALLPLVPNWPYSAGGAAVPVWFTDGGRSVPLGSTVVVYPFASAGNDAAMLWQATADMTFRMPGGYAVFADPRRGTASFVPALSPLLKVLTLCGLGITPQIPARQTRVMLEQQRASDVVVVHGSQGAPCAIDLFDRALGKHRNVGGVSVWRVDGATLHPKISAKRVVPFF